MNTIFKDKHTYIYLALGVISLVLAAIIGISDNPPGIILSFLGSVFFILIFTHKWQKPKPYIILLITSLMGFVVSIILHNVFEAVGKETILELVGVFFFLLAIFLCPAGIIVGGIGSLVKLYKQENK